MQVASAPQFFPVFVPVALHDPVGSHFSESSYVIYLYFIATRCFFYDFQSELSELMALAYDQSGQVYCGGIGGNGTQCEDPHCIEY